MKQNAFPSDTKVIIITENLRRWYFKKIHVLKNHMKVFDNLYSSQKLFSKQWKPLRKERIIVSDRCTSKQWEGKTSVAKVKRQGNDMQTPSERSLITFIVRINFIIVTGKNTCNAFPTDSKKISEKHF